MDSAILSALQTATTAAVAASNKPTLPIKYVGLTFAPPQDQRYLECVFLPSNDVNGYWGTSRTYRGAFRLLLHWGIDGGGPYVPLGVLQSVAAYFSKSRALASNVRIVNEANISGPIEVGSDVIWPATIDYRLFSA